VNVQHLRDRKSDRSLEDRIVEEKDDQSNFRYTEQRSYEDSSKHCESG